jgi:hypothetical protein
MKRRELVVAGGALALLLLLLVAVPFTREGVVGLVRGEAWWVT